MDGVPKAEVTINTMSSTEYTAAKGCVLSTIMQGRVDHRIPDSIMIVTTPDRRLVPVWPLVDLWMRHILAEIKTVRRRDR